MSAGMPPRQSYGTNSLANPGTMDFDEDSLHEPEAKLRPQLRALAQFLVPVKLLLPVAFVPIVILLVTYGSPVAATPAWVSAAIFLFAVVGIIPCSIIVVECLEDVVVRLSSEKFGVVVNVIFEHLPVLLTAIFLILEGTPHTMCWIKSLVLGCILVNLLAVLGGAIVMAPLGDERIGGFGMSTWTIFSTGLVFSSVVFTCPTVYGYTITAANVQYVVEKNKQPPAAVLSRQATNVLWLSRGLSALILGLYVAYVAIVFHSNLSYYTAVGNPNAPSSLSYAVLYLDTVRGPQPAPSGPRYTLSFVVVCVLLACSLQTWFCYLVVQTLPLVSSAMGIRVPFFLVILLPLVYEGGGFAAALLMARCGRLDLGASIPLSAIAHMYLCIVPLIVLLAWAFGAPLDLNFTPFLAAMCFIASLLVSQIVEVNRVRWLEGSILLALYAMVAFVSTLGGWHLCNNSFT